MSTALSVKATQQVFETANPVFIDYVYRIAEWTKGGIMTEKLYNDYKDYLINKLEVGNNGSSYLNLPVTVVNGDFVHSKYIKEYGTGQSRALEVGRVSGTLVNIKTDDVIVKIYLSLHKLKLMYLLDLLLLRKLIGLNVILVKMVVYLNILK